jgi:hypothetical protein
MSGLVLSVNQSTEWRSWLKRFPRVDVCQTPEYHQAYCTRFPGAEARMWCFEQGDKVFAYPFLLTAVGLDTSYSDISSVYGYSGPLVNSEDPDFLASAWKIFDEWSKEQKIIAEFVRLSIYTQPGKLLHPNTKIEPNRKAAVSRLPVDASEVLAALPSKTRNMIRKAQQSGMLVKTLEPHKWLPTFRELYMETMSRNQAPSFFLYDEKYFDFLFSLPKDELTLHGCFVEEKLVSAAMAIVYGKNALYHLGASLSEYSKSGAGNLTMYEMSRHLSENGVEFLNLGGGRTPSDDDSLFLFKKNNAMDIETFYIAKRIVNFDAYGEVLNKWQAVNNRKVESPNLIFYR